MSDQQDARQLVVFTLGNEEYALPINYVHEIIRYTEPRTIASEDPSVRGVISLRGKILPVFDLTTRLGVHSGAPAERSKIVIVETGSDMAGVVVDTVEEVLTVEDEQIDAAPGIGGNAIDGIAKIEDRLVVLLSPEAIVAVGADLVALGMEFRGVGELKAQVAAETAAEPTAETATATAAAAAA